MAKKISSKKKVVTKNKTTTKKKNPPKVTPSLPTDTSPQKKDNWFTKVLKTFGLK
jgi:hypothetical protein